ncbi:hypothetical protein D9M72_451050 [compost metagenome]
MRTVGVHFHEDVVSGLQAPLESGDIGGSQSGLAFTVQDVDLAVLSSDTVCQLACAVRAVVVHHQHIGSRDGRTQARECLGQRFQLVVGGDDGEDTHSEALSLMGAVTRQEALQERRL